MKRFLLSFVLILCLVFGINNHAIAKDNIEAIETISQIGSLANSGNYMQALDKCNQALKNIQKNQICTTGKHLSKVQLTKNTKP